MAQALVVDVQRGFVSDPDAVPAAAALLPVLDVVRRREGGCRLPMVVATAMGNRPVIVVRAGSR
jgi:hypothetical protein